jgi:hypothetical protein
LQQQVAVFNTQFNNQIKFSLKKIARVNNPAWFINTQNKDESNENPLAIEMKKALRQGGPADLNIYTVQQFESDPHVIGYGTFPWEYTKNPHLDGVVIQYSTLPGGSAKRANLGLNAAHEVGHW